MKQRFLTHIPVFLILIGCLALSGCAHRPSALSDWQPGVDAVMIVIDDPRSVRGQHAVSDPSYGPRLQYSEDPALHRAAARIAADYNVEILGQWPLRSLQVHCFVIAKPSAQIRQALASDQRVRWLQPFNEFETKAVDSKPSRSGEGASTAAVSGIARLVAQVQESGHGVSVAVIDTSVDQAHPGLSESSINQRNFAGTRGDIEKEAHGTAVVGVISAQSGEDRVRGLATGADVEVLRGCWQQDQGPGMCNTFTLALALEAAVQLAPDVLNLSLTGGSDRVLQELIHQLLARGTLVVASYDEKRSQQERFPAPAVGVIYAFGESPDAALSQQPGWAKPVVVSAPRSALTLTPMAGYDIVSGHSIAAPQISALAARLMHRYPDAPRARIQMLLQQWLNPTDKI